MLRSIELFILFSTLGSLSLVELQKCDPLAGYFLPESTLPCNKSRIEWHGDNEGLHLETSFADCERSGNESSVEKVTFSLAPNHPNIYTLYTADCYFEYSMQWLTNDTNCVVDLLNISTNNNIRDQNGLTNSPFEDLTRFAVNKIYKRSFYLNATILPNFFDTDFKFEFVCASTPPSNSSSDARRALITSITLVRHQRYSIEFYSSITLYHKNECSDCSPEPFDEATCAILDGYSKPQWIVNSSVIADVVFIKYSSPLFIFGDLITNRIALQGFVGNVIVDGCILTNNSMGYIHFQGTPNSFVISYNSGCAAPNFTSDDNITVTYNLNEVVIKVETIKQSDSVEDENYYRSYLTQLVGMIIGIVGAIGILVGIAVGIVQHKRRSRQRLAAQAQQAQDQEIEMQSERR
jgi:hypothetical protein